MAENDKPPQTLLGKPIIYDDVEGPTEEQPITFGEFDDIVLKTIAEKYKIPLKVLREHVRWV
jgi:hypothetical protein